jgi:O-antigen/teichoic acid export membrane protein
MYSLAQRALGAPSAIIGSSIGQVYLQQASEEKIITGKVDKAFMSTLKKLILLSMLFFLPLFFVVEDLFAVMFGESWREAGIYAKILIPYFAVNFIVSALSVTDSVMEKQYYYAAFNVVTILGVCVFFYNLQFSDPREFLQSLSFLLLLFYFLYLVIIYLVSRGGL